MVRLDAALAVDQRDAFLQEVADALRGCAEIGPGTVHRAIAEAQRRHWDPPDSWVWRDGQISLKSRSPGAQLAQPIPAAALPVVVLP